MHRWKLVAWASTKQHPFESMVPLHQSFIAEDIYTRTVSKHRAFITAVCKKVGTAETFRSITNLVLFMTSAFFCLNIILGTGTQIFMFLV